MIRVFEVVAPRVQVRRKPELKSQHIISDRVLTRGQTVRVDADSRTEQDGYVWWKHDDGWSASGTVSNSRVYMRFVADEDPVAPSIEVPESTTTSPADRAGSVAPASNVPVGAKPPDVDGSETGRSFDSGTEQVQFRVIYSSVRIRSEPRVHRSSIVSDKFLQYGQIVTVRPDSRTERDGYIWWLHPDGWSAETSTNGRLVFMERHQAVTFDDDPVNGLFLKVPWETQVGNWASNDCGPACILMLLRYRGLGKNETVDSLARIEPGLTTEYELQSLARKKGLTLERIEIQRNAESMADLRQYLLKDTPVILLVHYPALRFRNPTAVGATGHWLVIVGFDEDRFFVHDPLFGRDQKNHLGGIGGAYIAIDADRLATASRYLALVNPPQSART